MVHIGGALQVRNIYDAEEFVRRYAGYANADDVTILLAYRKCKAGLGEVRRMAGRADTVHHRRGLALCIVHFLRYFGHLKTRVRQWSPERMRRTQDLAQRYFLCDGVPCQYRAL